jgi:hypothetical protein
LIHHYSNNEWSGDDNDDYIDDLLCYQELLHSEIIDRCEFSNGHVINAQLSSDKSIIQEEFTTINGTERQDPTLNGKDSTNVRKNIYKTFSTMIKLISGALVGGTKYSDIYITSDIKEDDTSTASNNRSSITSKHHSNDQHRKIPTLQEVARKVARLEKMELDEKQYIAYEMIACTFLLGLVKDGNDSNTTLFTSLQKTMGGGSSKEIADIVKNWRHEVVKNNYFCFLQGLLDQEKVQ